MRDCVEAEKDIADEVAESRGTLMTRFMYRAKGYLSAKRDFEGLFNVSHSLEEVVQYVALNCGKRLSLAWPAGAKLTLGLCNGDSCRGTCAAEGSTRRAERPEGMVIIGRVYAQCHVDVNGCFVAMSEDGAVYAFPTEPVVGWVIVGEDVETFIRLGLCKLRLFCDRVRGRAARDKRVAGDGKEIPGDGAHSADVCRPDQELHLG